MKCANPGTPAPVNYRRPSTFSAACPGCGRTFLSLLAALSASLPTIFAAVTVVVLASLLTATARGQGDPEPCPGGGYNPVVEVAVTAVSIVVASTTDDCLLPLIGLKASSPGGLFGLDVWFPTDFQARWEFTPRVDTDGTPAPPLPKQASDCTKTPTRCHCSAPVVDLSITGDLSPGPACCPSERRP